jgi:hypothetical protein
MPVSPPNISRSQYPSDALGHTTIPALPQHPRRWFAENQLKRRCPLQRQQVVLHFTRHSPSASCTSSIVVTFRTIYEGPMKSIVPLAALAAGVVSQSTFEPADFNITEALLDNGVNVSALPDLSSLVDRSSTSGCSAAVSRINQYQRLLALANQAIVQVFEPHLWHRQT